MGDDLIRRGDALEDVLQYLRGIQADPMHVWDIEQILLVIPPANIAASKPGDDDLGWNELPRNGEDY